MHVVQCNIVRHGYGCISVAKLTNAIYQYQLIGCLCHLHRQTIFGVSRWNCNILTKFTLPAHSKMIAHGSRFCSQIDLWRGYHHRRIIRSPDESSRASAQAINAKNATKEQKKKICVKFSILLLYKLLTVNGPCRFTDLHRRIARTLTLASDGNAIHT